MSPVAAHSYASLQLLMLQPLLDPKHGIE